MEVGNFLQDKIDFEVIVIVNDASKKETESLQIFKEKKWFKYLSVPREPLYATWNRGVEMAQGDVIGFWNVDDLRQPEALIDGIDLIEKGVNLVYFPFTIKWYLNFLGIDLLVKKKVVKPDVFDRKKFTSGMHCGPFFLFAKGFYQRVGPFDEQFKIAGDFDWCVRSAKISNKFALSNINAGEFRVDGGGLSAGGKHQLKLENSVLFKRHSIPIKVKGVNGEEGDKFKVYEILHKGCYVKK